MWRECQLSLLQGCQFLCSVQERSADWSIEVLLKKHKLCCRFNDKTKLSIKIMHPVTSTRPTSSPAPAYKSPISRAITLFSSWGLLGSRNVKKLWRHSKRCCWTWMVTSCDSETESALNPSGCGYLRRWQLTTPPSRSLRLSSKKRPSMFGGNWQPMANRRICSICTQGKLIKETVLHFS